MQHLSRFSLLALLLLFFALPRVQGQGASSTGLTVKQTDKLYELVDENPVFREGHTGFCLYDLASSSRLYDYNADRLFVPASNVKLLTFYVANRVLGNRAPAVFYQNFRDHYELWGSGYPLTLHPQFLTEDLLTPWLRSRGVPLTLNYPSGPDALPRYGAGWSWDDYNGSYVYERSTLPLFGNRLYLEMQEVGVQGQTQLFSSPPGGGNQLRLIPDQERRIRRDEYGNVFNVRPDYLPNSYPLQRPMVLSPYWMVEELKAAVPGVDASPGFKPIPPRGELNAFEVTLPDTVYRQFLQQSDNYLAEQLLLLAASQRYGEPDEELIIGYARDTLFPALGISNIRWVDGSGLSRYNLVTPRQLTRLVMALDQEVGRERLTSLLPEGGTSGTLKRRFDGASVPYIWAKTGTLSGVTCVSGLMKTKKGRWLAFSFMHNNYVGGSRAYYQEMEKTLGWCFERL